MKKLSGKVAVVTAATKGIGMAITKRMAQEGAVVYIAARSEQRAEVLIKEIESHGGKAKFAYFNATEPETYTKIIEQAVKAEGHIDILVNNYGSTNVDLDKNLVAGDSDEFFRILADNVQSVYLPSKEAIKHMEKNGGGSIVNISSVGSIVPDISRIAYCVSKSAINSLTKNIAIQYARSNIRCNGVLPGLIATDAAMDNMSEDFIRSFLRHVPLNRMGIPEDIASAVIYLASDESGFMTGEILNVSGGFALGTPQYADFITK